MKLTKELTGKNWAVTWDRASNPEWWQFREQINITDKLLTLLVMRWS
jgi:hypothetical protein